MSPISEFRPAQKGLEHYRFRSLAAEVASARKGVRRWWWEYLRLSKDYWLICKTSTNPLTARTVDSGLAKIYAKFGDVYNSTFDDWWISRGAEVFQEQHESPKVRLIEDMQDVSEFREGKLLVEIPLALSRNTIQRKISEILKRFEEQRPNNRLETSRSNFPINPVRYRLHTLQVMHEVYCLHRELITKPEALKTLAGDAEQRQLWKQQYERRADLFRIGKLLHISPSNEDLTGTDKDKSAKRNRMRASVSRFLGRTEKLISNVEYGKFPLFTNHPKPEQRFTKKQLERHVELEEEWWKLDLTSQLTGNKVEAARTQYYSE